MRLIAFTTALILVVSCFTEGLTDDCKAVWEKYENVQVKGLNLVGDINTELDCKNACQKNDNCWNIDFNFKENSCWFGTEHKPTSRVHDDTVNHWDLTKDCTDELVKTVCTLRWDYFPNVQVKGLSPQWEIQTEEECKTACVAKGDCWNVDFNFAEKSCWFGTLHQPTNRVADNSVNHWDYIKDCKEVPPPTDCADIHKSDPSTKSGVYSIRLPGKSKLVQVYCDMDTDGGGWTVLQRRKDGSVNFERGWNEYSNGFGNLDGEFWWGNEVTSALSNSKPYVLRVDIGYFDGKNKYALYDDFRVAGAEDKFRLSFGNCSYSGNAGNALGGNLHGAQYSHNGMRFSTFDSDNDVRDTENCAKNFHGGWWYNGCHSVNLNGEYGNTKSGQGVNWNDWVYSLKSSEMKIRPDN